MKIFIFIISFTLAMPLFIRSQINTTSNKNNGYNNWSKNNTSLRVGFSTQKAFCAELGIAKHKYTVSDYAYLSKAYYATIAWYDTQEKVYALKAGYEANLFILALAIEAKYQTNFIKKDVVITPKIGLGFSGFINLFYGYNISTNNYPFTNIGNNEFTIIYNRK